MAAHLRVGGPQRFLHTFSLPAGAFQLQKLTPSLSREHRDAASRSLSADFLTTAAKAFGSPGLLGIRVTLRGERLLMLAPKSRADRDVSGRTHTR